LWTVGGWRRPLTLGPGVGAVRVAVRLPLLILLTTCQVDKLTNTPPPLATLALAPDKVLDSAAVGSTAMGGDSLAVTNQGPGTLSWTARLAVGDGWLTFMGPNSGTAPAKLRLAFNPAGLATGVYRDTVVVSAENAGTYWIEATSAGAGQTGKFTLSVTRPRPPAGPTTLTQLRSDSTTAISLGGSTDQASVVLRGVLADPDPADSLRLEVEVRPVGTAFGDTATQTGGRVANGQTGFVAVSGLANNTAYHWQARTVDQTGRASQWA